MSEYKKKDELDEELALPLDVESKEMYIYNDRILYDLILLHDRLLNLRDRYMDKDSKKVAYGLEIARVELNTMIKNLENEGRINS